MSGGKEESRSRSDIGRFALGGSRMNVAILDTDGTIVATNREWEEFGRANGLATPTLGVNYLDACDGADDPEVRRTATGLRDVLAGERSEFTLEYPCHSPDERRWFVMHAVRASGAEQYVVVTHANVTDRREHEFYLERYLTTIRNVPLVLFAFDADGTFTLSEGRGLEALGLVDGEVVGDSVFDRYADYPGVVADCRRALSGERVHATREVDDAIFEVVYQPMVDGSDEVDHVVGVARDVTKRERHERVFAALSDLTRVLMEAETADEVCELAVEGAEKVLDLPDTLLALFDESSGTLLPRARTRRADPHPNELLADEGVAWVSFTENEPRFVGDTAILPLGNHGVFVTTVTDDTALDVAELCTAAVESALGRAKRERMLREQEATLRRQNAALERLNELNEGIRRIDRALVEARTREEIERAVCRRLTSGGSYRFAWIGEDDPASGVVLPREWAGVERGFLDAIAVETDAEASDPTAITLGTGRAHVVQDVLRDPASETWRREALKRGYRSACSLPLSYGDAVYGVLTVYSDRAGTFDKLERSVLEDVSQTVAYAINAVESKKALAGGEVIELEFDVSDPTVVFVAVARETGGYVEFVGVVSKPNGTLQSIFTVRNAETDAVREVAARSLEAIGVELVSDRDDVAVFAATLTESSFVATLIDHGAVPETFVADGSSGRVIVRLSANADVRTFVEVLRTRFPDVKLRSRRQRERPWASGDFEPMLAEMLTDRQREVLEMAYYGGFFDSPRKSTGAELGRSLGISQPTFQHHLRAAERKLLRRLIAEGDV
ncbi:bacterio-opsin activator domain-containing protein [Haladaptatus salinisoli]|uniref:bacterio-opsin activator domain-containing protein n=1 Tax=Haladaptatus salinisoli TaxID=2884876 RepID=UPI001D09C90B|nr:bacterio-opsin activator domain-containing protein [Haladaptatus salinisoli]